MKILDGRKVAGEIEKEIRLKVKKLKSKGKKLTLAAILVGDDESSRIYIKVKERACRRLDLGFRKYELGENASEEEVVELIKRLNKDPKITGILLQLPLPKKFGRQKLVKAIAPEKDIDGFGYIMSTRKGHAKTFFSPTPLGIVALLEEYHIPWREKRVVIVGEGFLVGRPLKKMLEEKGAEVLTCDGRDENLANLTKEADILISASGKPHLIKEKMVKEGAVVVDVGNFRKGDKIVGDVDFEKVAPKTSFITPVPGGVGPMTVVMLLVNLVKAGEK